MYGLVNLSSKVTAVQILPQYILKIVTIKFFFLVFFAKNFITQATSRFLLKARMGEPGFFWCEHIVMSPKNVKTLHKQIIADIY